MKTLKFDLFGKDVLVEQTETGWKAFYAGDDGKRRPAKDIVLPSNIDESEIARYLDDLFHEWATDRNRSVKRVD